MNLHIKTEPVTNDYKIHGSHNRILDDPYFEKNFSRDNLYFDGSLRVVIRNTYDKSWYAPKIITISDMTTQDDSRVLYNICGTLDNATYSFTKRDGNRVGDLVIEGDFVSTSIEQNRKYTESLFNIIESTKDNIYFEHVVNDEGKVLFIRPYILVSLDGFYGQYKYYL